MTPNRTRYCAEAPSNIAFLKYWGKRDPERQWPAGPSLSMTLSGAFTRTVASVVPSGPDVFMLNGQLLEEDDPRQQKVVNFLDTLRGILGFEARLHIESENMFPESCGMASSASGFSAVTSAAICAWTDTSGFDELELRGFTRQRLASLARLGSGSACRSFWGGFVLWEPGESHQAQKVSQVYDADHWGLADVIVIPDATRRKPRSSSEAHQDAWTSPFFRPRIHGLAERRDQMLEALENRSLTDLGPVLEAEALEMHSVMMTTERPVHYLGERSLQILSWIRRMRQQGELKGYFTLDAGSTVHIITEIEDANHVAEQVRQHHPGVEVRVDQVGQGPSLTIENPQ